MLTMWLLKKAKSKGKKGLLIFVGLPLVLLSGGGVFASIYIGGFNGETNNNINANLLGYYKFNGNANDSSGNGYNGTVNGAVLSTDRDGYPNQAYSFNGTSNYISAPVPVPAGNTYSISAWVKKSSVNSQGTIASSSKITLAVGVYPCAANTFKLTKYTIADICIGSFPTDTAWHNVTAVWGPSGEAVYVDGVLNATASNTTNFGSTTGFYIGSELYAGPNNYWSGSIDDVRFYDAALNANQASILYKPPSISLGSEENGLVGWWKMHGNANDSTPYSNNGTVNSTVTLASDRFGNANSAYYFSGGAYESINATGASLWTIPNGEWSMSAWIDPTSYSSNPIILTGGGSGAYGYTLSINSSGQLVSIFCNTSGQCNTLTGGSISLNQWQLVTATDNGSTVQNYINGSLKGSTPVTYALSGQFQANEPLCMSNCGLSQKFSGSMSDVRIYNRALAASDVSSLYNSYNSQICLGGCGQSGGINLQKGLVGYWPFNGNAKDATPYGDDLQFNSGYLSSVPDRLGRVNSAYNFPGGYYSYMVLQQPMNPVLYTPTAANQWSMSAWVDPTSYGSGSDIIAYSNSSYGYSIGINGSGTLGSSFCNCTGSCTGDASGAVPLNQWSLVTATYDGTTSRNYLNGKQVGSNVGNWTLCFDNNQPLLISSPSLFLGNIDEVRIYNRALSAAEVQALYSEYQ